MDANVYSTDLVPNLPLGHKVPLITEASSQALRMSHLAIISLYLSQKHVSKTEAW